MGEIELVCAELGPALDLLRSSGFRLDVIYPADDPHTALLAKDGTTVRLTSRPDAPGLSDELPPFQPEFLLTKGGGSGEGRAGMLYRDLIPGGSAGATSLRTSPSPRAARFRTGFTITGSGSS